MTKVKGVIMKILIITSGIRIKACELDNEIVNVNAIKCGEYDALEVIKWITDIEDTDLIKFATSPENDYYNRLAIVCERSNFHQTMDAYHRNDEIKARLAKYPHLLRGKHSNNQESIDAYKKHSFELTMRRLHEMFETSIPELGK